MKLHPLHSAEKVALFVKSTGEYFPETRGTGRTTVQALRAIAYAIEHPGDQLYPQDHNGTGTANRELVRVIRRMVEALNLQHFTFTAESVRFG